MIESVLIRGHFGNPKRQRGTESRSIVPRQLFLKLRFFLHPPACGRVGRGSGRGGPSPGLRARLARLSQRESDISRHVFISCFTYPNSFSTVKSATPKLTLRVTKKSANASIVAQRFHYQRRFYLRPKFRQLQRLLGSAYTKSATAQGKAVFQTA